MQLTQTGVRWDASHILNQIWDHAPAWFAFIRPLALRVVSALGDQIPPEVLEALTDAEGGLDDAEIAKWQTKLTELANKAIDIPGLPESAEAWVISPIVGYLLSFAKSGKALTLSAG